MYDLLQFGFGHLNGFDSSRLDAGRLSVVDARGVCAAELELDACAFDDEPEPEEEPAPEDDDACAFCLYADAPEPPGIGEATRDDAGVESGVLPALPLSSSAVGAGASSSSSGGSGGLVQQHQQQQQQQPPARFGKRGSNLMTDGSADAEDEAMDLDEDEYDDDGKKRASRRKL